ncbi:helix-turn-helix transcriptional regulator [Thiohalocapsa marina]|uniref:helix-turn-helix transcriptional regulator n=1 Tax=Thiohalocapsa marina TaxID=424902 RepID=UPI0036D94D77
MKANTTRPTSDSVEQFCDRHGISECTFYRRRDLMPRAIKIGGQLRILDTDEQAWIEAQQAQADQRRAGA